MNRPTINTPKEEEQEYLSDSTLTNSSYSIDRFNKRPLAGTLNHKERSKKNHVGPKKSLSQFLERKSLFRKKPKRESTKCVRSPGKNMFKPSNLVANSKGGGDNIKHGNLENKVLHAAAVRDSAGPLEPQVFPFKSTPSGHYKLRPSQTISLCAEEESSIAAADIEALPGVHTLYALHFEYDKRQIVYESKNLSIVAADPTSVSLDITESETVKAEQNKKPFVDNWTTTCLYTTVGKADLAYSDFDTTSDSDRGNQASELSLAKMGYVTDNCIEWKDFNLPKKSDLKKVLLHNILNMIHPDIQVKVGNKIHKCHRIVLQCYSTFFASKTASQVEIPEASVPGDVFSLIYQWMLHMGTDSYRLLRRDNILHIFKSAQYLGIKELEDQCWAFIDNMEIFCEDKAFLLYLEARKLNNKDVMELMVPRVQRFFLTLVSSKEFIEFNSDEVCTFLVSNYICVHCEEEVFMAGVRWVRHDWSQRRNHAVKVMACVRFGLMNPKLLLAMRRDKSSPEFKPIINIPEVGKMVDDGLSIQILKLCFMNESAESIEKSKQNLNLEDPVPRNWAGTDRCYQSYAEFIKDLSHYRSKQRLEIKKSRIKMQMEKVDKDDFLSSAVLPPETQQKIKRLHTGDSSLMDCIPQLEQRELCLLRDMMCQEDIAEDTERKRMKKKLIAMASEDYDPCGTPANKKLFSNNQKQFNVRQDSRSYDPTVYEQDLAARKIQRAYRNYSSNKVYIKSSSAIMRDQAARKIQKAYREHSSRKLSDGARPSLKGNERESSLRWRSRSDPSLPSGLTKSSTHPVGKYKNDLLPLRVEKKTVFIFGGSNPFKNSDQNGYCIFHYQTESNEWEKCGEMPEPLHYHSVAYFQGRIYVAGGKNPSMFLTEPGAISRKVWRYDPQHKAWSRLEDMLDARRSFGLIGCSNKLYAVGGRNENDRVIENVEKLDTVSNSWVAVAPMHQARAGAAISDFKGKIWVAGGLIRDITIATNSVEYYNCEQNMWVECTSLRYTLAYGVMVPVNNRIFLVGGAVGLQDSTLHGSGKQIDVWDQESQTWCLAAMMSKPRHAHTAVYLRARPDTGYMFIMGGMSTRHNCVTNHVECWRVEDEQWIMGMAPLPFPMSGSAALALPSGTFG